MKASKLKLLFMPAAIMFVFVLLAGCTGLNKGQETEADGQWQMQGYGYYLEIDRGKVKSYQTTATTWLRTTDLDGSIRDGILETAYTRFAISRQGDLLELKDTSTGGIYRLQPETDSARKKTEAPDRNDSEYNFEVFWQSFNENYAFFDLYGVDWKEMHEKYASQVTPDMKKEALMELLAEMTQELNDDHISLTDGDNEFSPYNGTTEWRERIGDVVQVIETQYVPDIAYLSDKRIRYGWLNEHIGYLNLVSMAIDENTDTSLKKLVPSLEKALKQLQSAKTIVLDVRFNEGGQDAVSLAYASRFADQKRDVYSKKAWTHNGEEVQETRSIAPEGDVSYTGNVILLTSGVTESAAESFAQSMRQLPNVQIVGERTAGFFSDALTRVLPNGGSFTLSNERYFTPDGQLLEGRGITPDVIVPIELSFVERRIDPALDWVLNNN